MATKPPHPELDVPIAETPSGRITATWWQWLDEFWRWYRLTTPTATRPTLTKADTGFPAFDTTLGAPIWWDGTGWIEISGGGGGGGGVASVAGTPPVVSSGGANPAISMPAATASVNGYLKSADWTTFNNKANASHTHAQADVTNLVTDLAAKAPLASPTFTGDPKAPTPTAGDNDTSIATTAFVTAAVAAGGGGGGALTDGDKGDIVVSASGATWLFDTGVVTAAAKTVLDDTTTAAMLATMGGATLASPTFTGDPKAPTPAVNDNDTSIATTAFVTSTVGLVRISKTAVTGASVTVALPANYDKFVIEFIGLDATANADPLITLSINGSTYITTSTYYYGLIGLTSVGAVAGGQGTDVAWYPFVSPPDFTSASVTASATLTLYPGSASTGATGFFNSMSWSTSVVRTMTQGGYFANDGRVQALKLSLSSGTYTAGSIHLYGMRT